MPLSWLHGPPLRCPSRRALHPSAQTTRAGDPGWIDGGATSLDNLVLLCRRHHRAVHEGGFELSLCPGGTATFQSPSGTVLEAATALPVSLTAPEGSLRAPYEIPVWDGTPFDIVYTIDVLYAPHAPSALAGSAPP